MFREKLLQMVVFGGQLIICPSNLVVKRTVQGKEFQSLCLYMSISHMRRIAGQCLPDYANFGLNMCNWQEKA